MYFPHSKVVNCYLEAYHHIYDRKEKERLAKVSVTAVRIPMEHPATLWALISPLQVIVTLSSSRPRYSPSCSSSSYFTLTYSRECRCLKAHYQLLHAIINHQITEERAYNQRVFDSSNRSGNGTAEDQTGSYGLPPPLVPKQLVSLSGDRQLLVHSHLLEFCNSLCIVASLPQAVQWTLTEIVSPYTTY